MKNIMKWTVLTFPGGRLEVGPAPSGRQTGYAFEGGVSAMTVEVGPETAAILPMLEDPISIARVLGSIVQRRGLCLG